MAGLFHASAATMNSVHTHLNRGVISWECSELLLLEEDFLESSRHHCKQLHFVRVCV